MLGTASQSSQEGCAGTWLEERVKKLHTKLLVSQSVQTQKIKQRNPDCSTSVGILTAHISLQQRSEGVNILQLF